MLDLDNNPFFISFAAMNYCDSEYHRRNPPSSPAEDAPNMHHETRGILFAIVMQTGKGSCIFLNKAQSLRRSSKRGNCNRSER